MFCQGGCYFVWLKDCYFKCSSKTYFRIGTWKAPRDSKNKGFTAGEILVARDGFWCGKVHKRMSSLSSNFSAITNQVWTTSYDRDSKCWQTVAVYLQGPYSNGDHLLTLIDYRYRYPVVIPMRTITAEEVIKELRTVFGYFGLPATLATDNGRQFISTDWFFCGICQTMRFVTEELLQSGLKQMGRKSVFTEHFWNLIRQHLLKAKIGERS